MGIPMRTDCGSLVVDLLLFGYGVLRIISLQMHKPELSIYLLDIRRRLVFIIRKNDLKK